MRHLQSQCLVLRALTTSVLALLCMAQASTARASDVMPTLRAAQTWVEEQLAMQPSSSQTALRVEVIVGKLDPRLQLSPCAKVETFVPPGTKLWGRSRIGLRCTEGTGNWQVFLPVRIKAFGPAWVLRSGLPVNSTLSEQDAVLKEVDWAETASPVLGQAFEWVGKSLVRAAVSGETLSAAMVRSPPIFAAGAQVKLMARGPGFTISSAGHALSAGVSGQDVRVRLEGGRIVSGKVNLNGVVTMDL